LDVVSGGAAFSACCSALRIAVEAGFRSRSRCGLRCGCRCRNVRRSRVGWLLVSRCARSRRGWVAHRRRSRARLAGMVAGTAIEHCRRIGGRCGECDDRRGKAGDVPAVAESRGVQARVAVVSAADLGLAGARVSDRPGDARVARNDLSVVVCAIAWRAAQGTDSLSAPWPWHALAARSLRVERAGAARRHGQHSSATSGGRRSSRAGPLGGRLVDGQTHARNGHAG
jgi:hypothetical protein